MKQEGKVRSRKHFGHLKVFLGHALSAGKKIDCRICEDVSPMEQTKGEVHAKTITLPGSLQLLILHCHNPDFPWSTEPT